MYVDFKFNELRVDDDVATYAKVTIYRGNITTANDFDPGTHSLQPVTRYRRQALVGVYEHYFTRKGTRAQVLEFLKQKLAERAALAGADIIVQQSTYDAVEADKVSTV